MKERTRKYANGTGIAGYIKDPADTMADYDIMLAKAEQKAASNPWIPITMALGQIGSSVISSGAGASGKSATTTTATTAANGKTNASGSVEVEGGEVLDLPTSQVAEVKGPKHENGGVPLNLPEGTRIFSDRIVKEGKTMADRKKIREEKLKKMANLLEHKDIAVVNTAKRTKENLEREEAEDLRLQEIADGFFNMAQYAMGTGSEGIGPNLLEKPKPEWKGVPFDDSPEVPDLTGLYPDASTGEDNTIMLTDEELLEPSGYSNPELAPKKQDKPGTVVSRALDKYTGNYSPTAGDIVGLTGNMISAFGPLKNTLENRAGDTPNINAFEDFGKEALLANDEAMGYIGSQRDNANRRTVDNARSSKRAARNSARGINTMRAFDLGIDLGVEDANSNNNDIFAKQMMALLGQKSQLENMQDQVVMAGNQEKDLNNRKDRDNFYTQKGKDIVSLGTGVQQTGKDINDILKNPVYLNLLNEMGKYFTVNAKGELEAKTT